MNVQQLENELWEAADQLRANSKLTAAEYSMPVLDLIFLRHADNRFNAYPLIQQVRIIKKQNQQLAQARDLLLPKLMSGQLDVSGIALPDEVAS